LNYWVPLFIFVSFFTFSLEAVAQISVHFQANASVIGPRIVLADIATIQPSGSEAETIGQLPVASAPAPGAAKELYTVSIITSLRNRPEVADVDWQGSQSIVVQRKGTRIGQQQLQQIIADYLQKNSASLPKAEIRFTLLRAPEQLMFPYGALRWKVTPSRPDLMSSSSFSIFFTVDDKPAGNCVVRGKMEAITKVATAAIPLRRGDQITAEKIAMKQQSLSGLDQAFVAKKELLGMQMARTVSKGAVIEKDHIVSPAIIKDGEMVKIFARKGMLQISASGIAKTDGRLGETIRVKNISSNKLVHCQVDGPGIVSVEF
jgi:flagella basal body P-ring formation protein FlgA